MTVDPLTSSTDQICGILWICPEHFGDIFLGDVAIHANGIDLIMP
jgi:hypothetical protein